MSDWFGRVRVPADGNEWKCQFLDPAGTEFQAVAGPWGSGRPAFYSVAVERKCPDGTCVDLFSATYAVPGLPRGFCSRPIAEVVRFDAALGVVEFDLGGQVARCRLPGSRGSELVTPGQVAGEPGHSPPSPGHPRAGE